MAQKIIRVGDIEIANDKPMVLFGGMNVLESRDMAMQVCEEYVRVTQNMKKILELKLPQGHWVKD